MLTAVILKNLDSELSAPGLFLSDRNLAGLINQAAGFVAGDLAPVWLADRAAGACWPSGQVFATADSQLLPWIDSSDDCWLLSAAENLQLLLPQAHRLVILEYPVAAGLWPAEKLAGLAEPALSGYQLMKQSLLADLSGGTAGISFWSRPSAVAVLSEIIAGGDCDLHLHTRCSDGSDTPGQMVDRVLAGGLKAFAITDHDTLAALEPARQHLAMRMAASEVELTAFVPPVMVPGVELSVESVEEQHLLGYFPYGIPAGIASFLKRQQESRRQRNDMMIRQLQSLGYPISQNDFPAAGEGTVSRLQVALLLRKLGYFPSIDAAFDELLAVGRPAYVERVRPSAREAIWLIRQAGGVAVLAHPGLYGWCGGRPIVAAELIRQLASMQKAGLQGVEAFHGEASPEFQREISAAARALGLLRTGGSDDHGLNKAQAHMYPKGTDWLTGAEILVAAALISGPLQDGQPTWLLARRCTPGPGLGFWELPGGKVETGETPAAALVRELAEEMAVQANILEQVLVLTHDYPERRVILVCLQAKLTEENWRLTVHDDARFVTAEEALAMKLLPADYQIFQYLQQLDRPACKTCF